MQRGVGVVRCVPTAALAVLALVALVAASGCTPAGDRGPGTNAGLTVVATAPPATGPIVWTASTAAVGDGTVSISCAGAGPETVLFVGGLGETADAAWRASGVPDLVAHTARACVYDRPGLGASTPATAPRSVGNHVAELHALVTSGALPSPLVLVAQGYGCFVARQYAKEHVREVAGLVLIDPPLDVLDETAPPGSSEGVQAEYASIPELNANLGAYGAGALPPPPVATIVIGTDDLPALPPGAPAAAPVPQHGGAPTGGDRRRQLQAQLARKGPFGTFRHAGGAGTYVQYWAPATVADAIRAVLADDRGRAAR